MAAAVLRFVGGSKVPVEPQSPQNPYLMLGVRCHHFNVESWSKERFANAVNVAAR